MPLQISVQLPPTVVGNAATVLSLAEALYGAPPSAQVYQQQLAQLAGGNVRAAAYANQVVNSGFASLSDNALATLVLHNMLPGNDPNIAGLNASVTALLAANPANRGVVVLQLTQMLATLVNDPTYRFDANAWNQKIYQDYLIFNPPSRSYTLTTGPDTLTANSNDDVFYGTESTLTAGDKLDGGAGTDILKVADSGIKAALFTNFTAVNIEQLSLTSDAVGGGTISLAGMPDATLLINDNSSTNVTFTDVGRLAGLKLQNVSGGDTTVAFAPDLVKGGADTLNVALSNNKQINGSAIGNLVVNGIELMNITASAGSSKLAGITSAGSLVQINVSGDQDVDLGQVTLSPAANSSTGVVGGVNATQLTGKLSLGLVLQGGADQTLSVVGGHGTDTLRLSGTRADYQLVLGGDKSTIPHLHNVHASSADVGNINLSNLERLRFSDGAVALDLNLDQSGGKALELLGAVLGPNGPSDKVSVAALLALFDSGKSLTDAARLVVDSGYLASHAGAANASDYTAMVRYVYTNVNGQPPLTDTLAALLTTVHNDPAALAQWVATMATSNENLAHVQLTGYLQTGLAYA